MNCTKKGELTVAYHVFRSGDRDKVLTVLGYVAIVILTGAFYSAIKDFFYNKTKNYQIQLSTEGIRIGETFYDWKDVYETAILTKYTWGPAQTKYLIIAFNDLKAYEKFDLTHFVNAKYNGFSSTLSSYIEFYKPLVKD